MKIEVNGLIVNRSEIDDETIAQIKRIEDFGMDFYISNIKPMPLTTLIHMLDRHYSIGMADIKKMYLMSDIIDDYAIDYIKKTIVSLYQVDVVGKVADGFSIIKNSEDKLKIFNSKSRLTEHLNLVETEIGPFLWLEPHHVRDAKSTTDDKNYFGAAYLDEPTDTLSDDEKIMRELSKSRLIKITEDKAKEIKEIFESCIDNKAA